MQGKTCSPKRAIRQIDMKRKDMNMIKKNKLTLAIMTAIIAATIGLTACSSESVSDALNTTIGSGASADSEHSENNSFADMIENAETKDGFTDQNMSASSASASSSTLIDTSSMFTERDLEQEADLSNATSITLKSGEDVNITSEGVYVISGTASDTSIIVEVADTENVQIVLDGVSITNSSSPVIYVKSADKVFVSTTDSDNTLKVTGTFAADGTTNTDAVIYSKDDLVLNGKGTLTISSTENGITSKDDLKITGGTYNITSSADAIEANDSIRISDGTFNIDSSKDALHSENSDDNSLGYVYIEGGTFNIEAEGDGIQATTVLMINGGKLDITAVEGFEGTYVQINGGTINIEASDDGINATQKSTSYEVVIEVNDGDITVTMGSGDTDGFDSNGDIYINGGTISVTGNSAFDWDGEAKLNGGTVIVNGEELTELTNQFAGGMMGGQGGGPQNGQMPASPDGSTTDGSMPTPPDGSTTNGNMPTPPDGMTPPDGNGEMPQGMGGHGGGPRNGQNTTGQN